MKIRQALISLSDKRGALEFAQGLAAQGVKLLSTGGTAKLLRDAGLAVTEIGDYTGFPEMLDGRVKTLHPKVHGGILARRDLPEHLATIEQHGIPTIDLVCVNLYPFAATIAKPGVTLADAIENIDIGGPAMVRSSAKNYAGVAIVTDPEDYAALLEEMASHGGALSLKTRFNLAKKAFTHTARYDSMIANWLTGLEDGVEAKPEDAAPAPSIFPARLQLAFDRVETLRYGENSHQSAAVYRNGDGTAGLADATQLHGKEMSYNNYVDADAAHRAAYDFEGPAVAIIKHANPCGIATGSDIAEAHRKAHACDPVSAFGGVIAANRDVSLEMAEQVREIFTEVIVAPGYEDGALELLERKNQELQQIRSKYDQDKRRYIELTRARAANPAGLHPALVHPAPPPAVERPR